MKQDIQTTLFQLLKQKIAGEDFLGNVLSEVLSISPDAVYRRYRNQTPLTIQEMKKICNHFSISFDALCEVGEGKVVFTYQPLHTFDFHLESYLEGILLSIKRLKTLSEAEIFMTVHDVQFFQLLNFPQLMRFKLYFWAKTHLHVEKYRNERFKHERTSDTAFALGKEILQIYNATPSHEVYDPEFMRGFLRQIHYYYKAHLFDDPEYALFLHERILLFSSHLKEQASLGKKFMFGTQAPASGNQLSMYLNETINADGTFLYQSNEINGVFFTHNIMNYLETTDEKYVADTKQIIDKQLSNSSLISVVNEKERNNFFHEFDRTINLFKKKIEIDLAL